MKKIFTITMLISLMALTSVCQKNTSADAADDGRVKKSVAKNASGLLKYQIKPEDLPKPYATDSVRRGSKMVEKPAGAKLLLPENFKIEVYAEGGFEYPRWMVLAPNNDVFVADSRANKILILRDKNKDGKADERFTFAESLSQPFGMAFYKDWFYVANTDSIVRFKYKKGQTQAIGAPEKVVELTRGGYNQHWTRNVIFSPKGDKMFVAIGSETNASVEEDSRRAAISVYNPDGKNHKIYASGLRNPIGLAFNPANGELWTAVNERDGLGDNLVPDYITSVKENGFYGFPYVYIGKNIEPRLEDKVTKEHLEKVIVPDVLLTAHSAALGIVFYGGKMFPKEYQGDAFVALHGSWNREKLTGYKIIRVKFKNGKLENNGYEDFVKGWLPEEDSNEVWGRPVGLLVNSDGSLLIADDGAKKIWRVSYSK